MKIKTKETYLKGKIYHLDNVLHLPQSAMGFFRKPINKQEDPLFKQGDSVANDTSDLEVCTQTFKIQIIIYTMD